MPRNNGNKLYRKKVIIEYDSFPLNEERMVDIYCL